MLLSKRIGEVKRLNESVYKVTPFLFPKGGKNKPKLEMLRVQIALAPSKVSVDDLMENEQKLKRFYSENLN